MATFLSIGQAGNAKADDTKSEDTKADLFAKPKLWIPLAGIVVGLSPIVIYSLTFGRERFFRILGLGLMAALGAVLFAGLIGFLVGVPSFGREQAGSVQPNTGVADISKWLVGIVVGVGIAQFDAIGDTLGNLIEALAAGFAADDVTTRPFSGFLIAYHSSLGFILGFYFTSIYYLRQAARTNSLIHDVVKDVAVAVVREVASNPGQASPGQSPLQVVGQQPK